MSNIISDAMIVCRLAVSCFGNSRTDRAAGITVQTAHGADSSAGRYSKHLIDPKALKELTSLAANIRAAFVNYSLPYCTGGENGGERGERLIPARSLGKFETRIREAMNAYSIAADMFCDQVYPGEVSRAAARLGSLYDPADYPDAKKVRSEFSATLRTFPIPDMTKVPAGSWIGLAADHEKRMKEQLLSDASAAETAARREVFSRMNDHLVKIAEKLSGFDPSATGRDRGIFRDSLIGNLIEDMLVLPDLIPANGDPELVDTLREIKSRILSCTVEKIREDKLTRDSVTDAAKDIAAKLQGIF